MNRREFNRALGGSLVALQLAWLSGCDRSAAPPELAVGVGDPDARQALEATARGLEGIDFVGPFCDRRMGDDDPLGTLMNSLDSQGGSLLDKLRARMSEDFMAGRVIEVDGWRLSQSECLLLAGAARLKGLSEPRRSEAQALREAEFITIERWGPDRTVDGELFNPQTGGRAGLWLRVDGEVNGSMRLEFDGVELATHFEPGVITASLDPDHAQEVIGRPGAYEVALLDKSRQQRQSVGVFTVLERPPAAILVDGSTSTVFCEVGTWGPDMAVVGEAFNRQPDGSAAFWVHVGCAPKDAYLELDGVALPSSVRPGLATARVPHFAELTRGEHPLDLVDPASGERLRVGELTIQ